MRIKHSFPTLLSVIALTATIIWAYPLLFMNAAQASPGWLTGWTYRRQLTIDGTQITGPLSDFPVLVKLDSSVFDFSKAQGNGQDVRFTASDGLTLLKYEIERWDSIGEKAEIWVKIPSAASGSDTVFFMYYDNSGASDAQDPENVWDSSFKMVHHLEETSGTVTDSTSNNNDGTYNGAAQDAEGKIDGADEFDGDYDYIAIPHSDTLNLGTGDFTISVWVKYPATPSNNDADILRKGNTLDTPPNNYKLELSSNRIAGNLYDGGNSRVETTETFGDDEWHFVVFLRESSTIRLYVDGAQKDSAGSAGRDVSNSNTMSIGSKNNYADDFFDGIIDEVRISTAARSEAWIEASYSSMKNELLSYGPEMPQNESPDKPANPEPADEAINVPIAATLSVTVTDPDGDPMDVSFYQPGTTAEDFTIIVLPDTQYYSQSYPEIFDNQTKWIVDNIDDMNIIFVTHEGDIVEVYSDTAQWDNADHSLSMLDDEIPYGLLPGNHDGSPSDANLVNYNTYFGYSKFNGESWYGGAHKNNNTNSYQLFTGGNDNYLILHLQYNPSLEVLEWANNTITSHTDKRVIVTTHDYLTTSATRSTIGEGIWQNFIKHHTDQIFLVLCGHASGEARLTSTVDDHKVYQVLANYQGRTNGGNGWLRTLSFHPTEDKIYFKTYSPYLKSYETDSESQFTLDYDMTGSTPPTLIGTDTNVPSGGTAQVQWNGLDYLTTYRWYTIATDSHAAATQSDTWSFTTTIFIIPEHFLGIVMSVIACFAAYTLFMKRPRIGHKN